MAGQSVHSASGDGLHAVSADIFGAVILASRLQVPDGTAALLVDLDGVILDTLSLEYDVVNEMLDVEVPRDVIRRAFPHPIPESWRMMLDAIGEPAGEARIAELTE